jgi:type II secretory pathway pseudopilin PulG
MYRSREIGFTLLEIVLAISILTALAIITIAAFSPFKQGTDLDTTTERVLGVVLEARAKTLSSQNASQHGVHFETSRVVLFVGSTYNASDPTNEELLLPDTIDISAITLNGGGDDVIFTRLTGETAEYGTITLELLSDTSQTKQISITPTGLSSVL